MTTTCDAVERLANFIQVRELCYGSIGDFVRDNLAHYLAQGIVSKECSEMSGWESLPVKFIDIPPIEHFNPLQLPLIALEYNDKTISLDCSQAEPQAPIKNYNYLSLQRTKTWDFDVVQVELPEGWVMERGCECGSFMNSSSFMVKHGDQVKGNFAYFPNETRFLTGLEQLLWME